MKHFILILSSIFISGFSFAQTMQVGNIKVTKQNESFEFPGASLELEQPKNLDLPKADTINFQFEVEKYTLGNQTPDNATKRCANSAKGQHIHFILDNKPYEALYKPQFKTKVAEGNHILLAFLSRSYHESIKSKSAFVLKQFTVGKSTTPLVDLKKPMLFFSRPKGIYIGADTGKVLLDFYLVNVKLSSKGYKVKATVNGKEFLLSDWKPYLIEGLPMGESTIKLELIDKKGKPVAGPYNSTERKITLAASEPLKR